MGTHHGPPRTTFETPWGKFRNLLGTKSATDVTLLPLSAVDNDIFVYFLCRKYGLWNQLSQYIFIMLVLGLPVQLKWILKKLSWETMVSFKCLFGEWTAVRE